MLTVLHASVDLYFSTAAQADAAAAEQQLEAEQLAGAASHVQSTGPAKMLKGEGKPAAVLGHGSLRWPHAGMGQPGGWHRLAKCLRGASIMKVGMPQSLVQAKAGRPR